MRYTPNIFLPLCLLAVAVSSIIRSTDSFVISPLIPHPHPTSSLNPSYSHSDYQRTGTELFTSTDRPDTAKPVSKRVITDNFRIGSWNVVLQTTRLFVPLRNAASALEHFYQGVMGRATSYQAFGNPEENGFQFISNNIALTFQCYRGDTQTAVPWPLIYSFAQMLLRRAQMGMASQFKGSMRYDLPTRALF